MVQAAVVRVVEADRLKAGREQRSVRLVRVGRQHVKVVERAQLGKGIKRGRVWPLEHEQGPVIGCASISQQALGSGIHPRRSEFLFNEIVWHITANRAPAASREQLQAVRPKVRKAARPIDDVAYPGP